MPDKNDKTYIADFHKVIGRIDEEIEYYGKSNIATGNAMVEHLTEYKEDLIALLNVFIAREELDENYEEFEKMDIPKMLN